MASNQVMLGAVSIERRRVLAARMSAPSETGWVSPKIDLDALGRLEAHGWAVELHSPTSAIDEALKWLFKDREILSLGVAAYGPFETLDGNAATREFGKRYGKVRSTAHWAPHAGLDIFEYVRSFCDKTFNRVPEVTIQTDASTAALGEYIGRITEGHLPEPTPRSSDWLVYLMFSEGIGGGFAVRGEVWSGALHPEMGQVHVARHPDDTFKGVCAHHGGDCLEGLASFMAVEQRCHELGLSLSQLKRMPKHPIWLFVSDYVAQLCVSLTFILAPRAIVLGGHDWLPARMIDLVRSAFERRLVGIGHKTYFDYGAIGDRALPFLSKPLIKNPELLGALRLAQQNLTRPNVERIRRA